MMARRHFLLCLMSLLAGCRVPPAPVMTYGPACSSPRMVLLTRQVMTDTTVEMYQHPLRSGWSMLSDPVHHIRFGAEGLFCKRFALALASPPPPLPPSRPVLDREALEGDLEEMSGHGLVPASIRLATDGDQALADLEQLIDGATCRIDVLMYLWDSDPLGAEVAARLAARAGPQLPVRVLVDGGGNLIHGLPKSATAAEVNRVVVWLARQPYVQVIRTRDPALRFDHRKLVVVDGRAAWSGGRNFTQPSFYKDHDLSFTVAGPLAGEMEAIFEEFWRQQGGPPAMPLEAPPDPAPNARGRLVVTGPNQRHLAQSVYEAVDRARHHVYVENPYLTDSRLQYKLAGARRRGADVRVILTIQDGSKTINLLNRLTANRLLRVGVRVYIYPGMTHVKATVVDGCWAYLGTGNFDWLSMSHNHELGVAVSSGPVIAELEERLFEPDLCPEWEVKEPFPVTPGERVFELLASSLI